MTDNLKKRIKLLGIALPIIALCISFVFSLEPFENQLNWASAILACLGCWVWAHVIGQDLPLVFSTLLVSLLFRAGLLMWIVTSDVSQTVRLNAVLFLVGYHLLEVGGVTVGGWKYLFQAPSKSGS